jgi:uncharacterized protein (TIGR02118 family)
LRFFEERNNQRGEGGEMIKAIFFIKRKAGMSLEDFREYWIKNHAPVVLKIPGLVKYVQSHTMDSGYRNHEPIYDGIAELWYESIDDMRKNAGTAIAREGLEDDEKFLDMSKLAFILTRERVQKENPIEPGAPKMVAFLKKRPELSVETFQAHWNSPHGKLGAAVPGARRYVQCHPIASSYEKGRTPPWDGVAEVWFDSDEAMRSNAATPEYKAVLADEPNFLAGSAKFIITTEHVIL